MPDVYTYRGFDAMLGRASFSPAPTLVAGNLPTNNIAALMGARNIYFGGIGRITGTVKNTPATPVERRLLLLDEATRIVTQEVWSDALTGAYTFNNLDMQARYTVLSYDHTTLYRAVVADRQQPELMPS